MFSQGGALLALASGKAERRQVHPLEGSQNPLLICCPPIQAVIWLGDRLADTPLRGKSASPYSVHNVPVAPLLGDMVDIFTYRCLVIEYTLFALKYNKRCKAQSMRPLSQPIQLQRHKKSGKYFATIQFFIKFAPKMKCVVPKGVAHLTTSAEKRRTTI